MSSTPPFILIVDDNPTNLSVLSQALKLAGYKVRMASDGEEALAQVEIAHPELILLDVEMPNLDGFCTCQRLKANPITEPIPILFMTALADTAHKVKGLSLGAVDYITKPFEQAEVLARVKIHWRLKQLTDNLEQQVVERTQALQQAQIRLVQQEKLSALGQLIAGVAHEINNPIGCIVGNVNATQDYINDLLTLIALYQQQLPQPGIEIRQHLEDIDLEFLQTDLPNLIRAMQEGSDRIKAISHSLRTFSRADTTQKQLFNLHEGIDSTLLILRHRLRANNQRPEIQVIKDYADLPEVACFPGQLNQVFMNLLANAIDMFDDMDQPQSLNALACHLLQITIRTTVDASQVQILIGDNGTGMAEDVRTQVFDHLFTTKGMGKGTGLGLAIAHQIVVEKHGGSLDVQSTLGGGSEFCIRLPIVGWTANFALSTPVNTSV
jgi:signal transduction histidine kinase